MRTLVVAVTIVTSILCAGVEVESQDDRLVIVVETFENPANYYQSTIGNALTDMFITSLSRTGTFTIMDARRPYGGEADLYVSAKVTNFSYSEREIEAQASNRSQSDSVANYEQSITVRIDLTTVDDAQEIVFAEAVERSETNISTTAMVEDYERLLASSVSIFEMTSSMMGRATEAAIEHAVERVTTYFDILGPAFATNVVEGEVLAAVDDRSAVIDRGRSAGIQLADELQILRGKSITNDVGRVVFTRRVNVGTATVSEVGDDGALIEAVTATDIREGDFFVRTPPVASASERIDKGTAFLNADFFHAAVREFRAARDLDPPSLDVHFHLGLAYLKTDNTEGAFDSLSRYIDAGEPIELAARHGHAFGGCDGTLTLTRNSVAYRSPDESDPDHWFDVPLAGLVEQRVRTYGALLLRAASAEQVAKNEGDTKNWTFRSSLLGEYSQLANIIVRYINDRRY